MDYGSTEKLVTTYERLDPVDDIELDLEGNAKRRRARKGTECAHIVW